MNYKRILLTALALTLPLAGAKAVTFTTNATISVTNLIYESQPIIVSNCTLTVNGPHGFASLLLMSNAVLTHTAAPAGETNNRVLLTITGDATVDAASRIDVSGKGYGTGAGPGKGGGAYYGGAGGGYGGPGGNGGNGTIGGPTYGSYLAPVDLGSGGGADANCGLGCPGGAGAGSSI